MSTSPENAILSIAGLNKSYGSHKVLRDLNLDVVTGAIHGLVGLNGSGKTTTLECLLGLLSYNSGSIHLLGHSPARLNEAKGNIVGIFDTPSLSPQLTVRQCLQQASLLCDTPTRNPEQVERMLGIEPFSQFRIRQLSLGNKRRASIAQALLGDPALIILDEPFNGLDAGGVDEVLTLIQNLNKELGTSFLLSSHQLPYLENICSHIAILHKGQIAVSDTVSALLSEHRTEVLVKTAQTEHARQLITSLSGCQLQADNNGYLKVTLQEIDSASLNSALVGEGIAVQELVLQRPSLDKLFRQITAEAAS